MADEAQNYSHAEDGYSPRRNPIYIAVLVATIVGSVAEIIRYRRTKSQSPTKAVESIGQVAFSDARIDDEHDS